MKTKFSQKILRTNKGDRVRGTIKYGQLYKVQVFNKSLEIILPTHACYTILYIFRKHNILKKKFKQK